jgi:hypothetical protein
VQWLAVALALAAQQEAERLDLIDLLDEVDPTTRDRIEAAMERGADLSELPILVSDLALAPRTRDGAVTLFAAFSHRRSEDRSATSFVLGLAIAFDELMFPPDPYGSPSAERARFERCREAVSSVAPDPISAAARAARLRALACGGGP